MPETLSLTTIVYEALDLSSEPYPEPDGGIADYVKRGLLPAHCDVDWAGTVLEQWAATLGARLVALAAHQLLPSTWIAAITCPNNTTCAQINTVVLHRSEMHMCVTLQERSVAVFETELLAQCADGWHPLRQS
jgi:hypothetical protein